MQVSEGVLSWLAGEAVVDDHKKHTFGELGSKQRFGDCENDSFKISSGNEIPLEGISG